MDRDALIALLREHFNLSVSLSPGATYGVGGGAHLDVTVALYAEGMNQPVLTATDRVSMSELPHE